jgi:hypothetical protein
LACFEIGWPRSNVPTIAHRLHEDANCRKTQQLNRLSVNRDTGLLYYCSMTNPVKLTNWNNV